MVLQTKKFYVIKQADGILWNFTYKDNFGIIYRTFDKTVWSTYNILVKNASEAFSALILPDNRIYIIYQSDSGDLLLKVYYKDEWKEYSILHKKSKDTNDIYFKTIYTSRKIQIFYSIHQPHDNTRALFHQTLELNNNLKVSSPVLIDTTNVNHMNQFVVHTLEDNSICIMYQKLLNKYELGYKIFSNNSSIWSKFYNVDKNLSPYIDYSLSSVNNKLNILYIKNNGETNALYNFWGYTSNPEHTKLAESSNLISCALFREGNITYGFWISNNYLYSYYTNDMGANISPIKSEGLKSLNIFKSSFIEISSENKYISNELYVQDGTTLTMLPNNFFTYKETLKTQQPKLRGTSRDTELSPHSSLDHESEYLTNNAEEKILGIEMKLIKKDQLINQLNYIIKEEKNKVLLLNNKISLLEKNSIEWEKQKSQFYKDISLLQESLISKETEIHELEKKMIENNVKLTTLNKLNTNTNTENQHKENLAMETDIEEYKTLIITLNKVIENLNYKITTLEEEKIKPPNDKTNNSLFKKLFNSQ